MSPSREAKMVFTSSAGTCAMSTANTYIDSWQWLTGILICDNTCNASFLGACSESAKKSQENKQLNYQAFCDVVHQRLTSFTECCSFFVEMVQINIPEFQAELSN